MTQTNAQVALLAAVQSINSGDIWQGRESVAAMVKVRRSEYLSWLNAESIEIPNPIDLSKTINTTQIMRGQ